MLKTTTIACAIFFYSFSYAQVANSSLSGVDVSDHQFAVGIVGENSGAYTTVLNWLESNQGLQVKHACESQSIVWLIMEPSVYKSYDVFINALASEFPDFQFYRKNLQIFNRECAGESQK